MNINFKVKEQKLVRCDTKTVAENSKNFLYAVFDFDTSWKDHAVKAVFRRMGKSYSQVLTDARCTVPYEVIEAATERDLADIAMGEIPASMRAKDGEDMEHGNYVYNTLLGQQVYKKMVELGYIG